MFQQNYVIDNKVKFLELLDSITIEGADKEGLKQFLETSDFFTAPASTKYHNSFEGGLCAHSLNVYANLCKLANNFAPGKYHEDTLKVTALFHDISKANYYESYFRNVNTGEKDTKGRDIWDKVKEYKLRDKQNRMLAKDHEVNSYLILEKYIPLSDEEAIAIMNHHGGWGLDTMRAGEVSAIYEEYTLAVLLHLADMVSVYISEKHE